MTIEQLNILSLLKGDGLNIILSDVIIVHIDIFAALLRSFTWGDAPPRSIAPKLVANYGGMDFTFDLYTYDGFRLGIYYSVGGAPVVFTLFGEGGAYVFARRWEL